MYDNRLNNQYVLNETQYVFLITKLGLALVAILLNVNLKISLASVSRWCNRCNEGL